MGDEDATFIDVCACSSALNTPGLLLQSEKHRAEEDARLSEAPLVLPPNLYFTKQSACRGV